MKTIVALVDFSDVTPNVIERTRALAKAFQSRVILLHGLPRQPVVVDVAVATPTLYREPGEQEIRADEERLGQLGEPLTSAGIPVSLCQLRHATVEHIVEQSEKLAADLIVVGSHRHGALYNLIVGSVTAEVLQRAKCPVLVVPDTGRP